MKPVKGEILPKEKQVADPLLNNKEYQKLLTTISRKFDVYISKISLMNPNKELMEKVVNLQDICKQKDSEIVQAYQVKTDQLKDPDKWAKEMITRAVLRSRLMLKYLNKQIKVLEEAPAIYVKR